MSNWHKTRGFVAAGVAFVSCPCHLPLTLPILLAMTAGTAVGGWLANNTTIIYAASVVLFIGELILAGKWLMADEAEACPVDWNEKQPTEAISQFQQAYDHLAHNLENGESMPFDQEFLSLAAHGGEAIHQMAATLNEQIND